MSGHLLQLLSDHPQSLYHQNETQEEVIWAQGQPPTELPTTEDNALYSSVGNPPSALACEAPQP